MGVDSGMVNPALADLVRAVGAELGRTTARLRRVEFALLNGGKSDAPGTANPLVSDVRTDIQMLDLVIQTLDDLGPLLEALGREMVEPKSADASELLGRLRLEDLRRDLSQLDGFVTSNAGGSIEMF